MWRGEKSFVPKKAEKVSQSEEFKTDTFAVQENISPDTLSVAEPGVEVTNILDPSMQQWRSELAQVGGVSPLLFLEDGPDTCLELNTSHPGGLPQFITGQRVLLSNLIRDEVALRAARAAAERITAKGTQLRVVRGIESIHLATGLVKWKNVGLEYAAPVLLRPLAIRRYGKDFELKLKGETFLNPQLLRVFAEHFHIFLDAKALVALSVTNGVFKPQPVIDKLRLLTQHLPTVHVQPRLLVSSFASVGSDLSAELDFETTPIIEAVGGNPAALKRVKDSFREVGSVDQDLRAPDMDALLFDADEKQEEVIAQIAAGNSIVLNMLPGTGSTQTIVNAIGALVSQHKRVLVVSALRASLDDIADRFRYAGVPGGAVRIRTMRKNFVQTIVRNEKATQPDVTDIGQALIRLRKVLLDYRHSLTKKDPVLNVSLLDALRELSKLSLLPSEPSTTVRLDAATAASLANQRDNVVDLLIRAARLGQFRYGPNDSPWYGAAFSDAEQAHQAHEGAKKLYRSSYPRLLERAQHLIQQTPLRPFENLKELGIYLQLLADIRMTLDKFVPTVYERSLKDVIIATGPRRDSANMTAVNRRNLRRLATEYVRPGMSVPHLHEQLKKIQQQRIMWNRFVSIGLNPEVPVGLADVHSDFVAVMSDLSQLDGPLGRNEKGPLLSELPLDQLQVMLGQLAQDSEVLNNLQERTTIMLELQDMGLDQFLTDLSIRHVPEHAVSAELEMAWWKSVLDVFLTADKALLNGNTAIIDRLEADFRLVDETYASTSGKQLAWTLAQMWNIGVVDWEQEAKELKRLLLEKENNPAVFFRCASHLMPTLAPVWLVSPYEVSALGKDAQFDAVFVVDAGSLTLAESIPSLRRAQQVVICGDPVTQRPSDFKIAIGKDDTDAVMSGSTAESDSPQKESVFSKLVEILPEYKLTRSYRPGGQELTQLVNRRFYDGTIEFLPWAGSYLGRGSLEIHYVDNGRTLPDRLSSGVESPDAEVQRVVELVLNHAAKRANESLMVIAVSPSHAVRVHEAVLAAASLRTDLKTFFLQDTSEPFTVLTLEECAGQSRDRVIFSVGFGRTPHGRLLSDFGVLSRSDGEHFLAVGMTRARRGMDVVSCFTAEDIEKAQLQYGIVAFANVLKDAQDIQDQALHYENPDADPMIIDLAARLARRGLKVERDYRGLLGLVASFEGRAVVVETDDDMSSGSLRESLRLRPEILRRLGWHYIRIHSFELFADPVAVIERICSLVGNERLENATDRIVLDRDALLRKSNIS